MSKVVNSYQQKSCPLEFLHTLLAHNLAMYDKCTNVYNKQVCHVN